MNLNFDQLKKNEGCEHKVISLALKTKVKSYDWEQEEESQSNGEDLLANIVVVFTEMLKKNYRNWWWLKLDFRLRKLSYTCQLLNKNQLWGGFLVRLWF